MWIILVIFFVLFNFLHSLNAVLPGQPPGNATTGSDESYSNDDPRNRSRNLNGTEEESPEPRTPQREWLSSDDDEQDEEEELYSNLESSTELIAARDDNSITFVNDAVPRTPRICLGLSDDGSDSQGDHLPSASRSVSTPIPRKPDRGYDFGGQKILFFELDTPHTNSHAEIELSELIPSAPGEPVDLDSGTVLITSLKDTKNNNDSRKVEFRMSPLLGTHDVVLVYTAEGVLAARISNTHLKESRAFIDDTITKLQSLAESSVSSPKTISWLLDQCEAGRSLTPPIRVCFIITTNDWNVIKGSRVPDGVPRNTYIVFSGMFCSVRLAFDKYFDLKGRDITDVEGSRSEYGVLERSGHKLNGKLEVLITCPRIAHGLDGGIFVNDEDGGGWNEHVTL